MFSRDKRRDIIMEGKDEKNQIRELMFMHS